ncbi:pentapeptide repeat-containing protein [Nocardia coubleae]|uniref:Pentapeptide repeat-containing protein n=1 Tax=Nocardia coubleae TaxID=356147 RepID=A0A846W4B5_9NOCA|nr:pentapeptide repeat-containing protein [Nocardia coubleae]
MGRRVRFEPGVAVLGELRPAVSPDDDPVGEREVSGVEYRDIDFADAQVYGFGAEGCRFVSVRFPTLLRQTTIAESELQVCDLANVQADDSSMFESVVGNGRITGLSWTAGVLRDVLVESTRADMASFAESRLSKVVFRDCDLRQADFQRTDFRNVRFERCNLAGARFTGARIQQNLRFEDCDLTGIYGVTALRGATIQGGDLETLAATLARELGITVELGS